MAIWNLIDLPFASLLTSTLIHFLWQGTVIAALAALIVRAMPRSSASARYLIYVTALFGMVVCVPLTYSLVSLNNGSPIDAEVANADTGRVSLSRVTGDVTPSSPLIAPTNELVAPATPDLETASSLRNQDSLVVPNEHQSSASVTPFVRPQQPTEPSSRDASFTLSIERVIAWLYFIGVAFLLLRLAHATWRGMRLRQSAYRNLDQSLLSRVESRASSLGMRCVPMIKWSEQIAVPVVVGFFRPMVLLPASAATGLSADQLIAVIAHELAHIRRFDPVVNLLQRVIETLLFFHPAVWWISRQAANEREQACDEMVLGAGFARAGYADALLRMAEVASLDSGTKSALGSTALAADGATPTMLKRRILKVLQEPANSDLRPSRWALVATLVIVVSIVLVPGAFLHFAKTAPANEREESFSEKDDATMEFLQAIRPDSEIVNPAAKGREFAQTDIKNEIHRILYFGKPWSNGKPLIDDQTGYRVDVTSGCLVTREFVLLVNAYNATVREHFAAQYQEAEEVAADSSDEQKQLANGTLEYKTKGNRIELAFSPNGRRLAVMNGNPSRTMFRDGRSVARDWQPTVDIIDTETTAILSAIDLEALPQDQDRAVEQGPTFVEATAIAFSPDSGTLAVGTSVGQLLLYDVETGELIKPLEDRRGNQSNEDTPEFWKNLHRVMGRVKSISFSSDGKRIAVCGDSFADWTETLDRVDRGGLNATEAGRFKVFDIESGDLVFNPEAHSDMVADVAYSPDGRFLASAGRWMDGFERGASGDGVILWDADTGEELARLDLELRGWIYDIDFSQDGERILVGAQDFDSGGGNGQGVAAMLASETLAVLWRRSITRSAMEVAFNPQQSAVIALANREGLTYINADSGETVMLLTVADTESPTKQRCEDFAISHQGHLMVMGVVEAGEGQVQYLRIGELDANDASDDDQAKSQMSDPNECVLSMGTVKFMLDLDTGATMDPPQVQRPEQKDMDIHPQQFQPYDKPDTAVVFGLNGVKVSEEMWDATASEVVAKLSGDGAQALSELPIDSDTTATYVFETSDGTRGVLQLLGVEQVKDAVNEPWGLRVRYKIVQPVEYLRAAPAATSSDQPSDHNEDEDEASEQETNPYSRTITLSVKDRPVDEVMREIAKQAGLTFVIDMNAVGEIEWDPERLVTLNLKDAPFAESVADAGDFETVISSGTCWTVDGDKLLLTTLEALSRRRADKIAALDLPDWLMDRESGVGCYVHNDNSIEISIQRNVRELAYLEEIGRLPNVTKLRIDASLDVEDDALQFLTQLEKLERLEMTHSPPPEFKHGRADLILSLVKDLPSLREVSLIETGATHRGFQHLVDNRTIKILSIYQDGGFGDAAVEIVSGWEQLETLSLTQYVFPQHMPKMAYSADALRKIAELENLKHLTLIGFEVPPEAIATSELRSLHLSGSLIDDESAERIARCSKLNSLTLSRTRIGDDGLKLIADGTALHRLTLTGNQQITDTGIAHLRSAPLRHIELRNNNLSNRALMFISEIKTLRRLDIYGTNRGIIGGGPDDPLEFRPLTIEGMKVLKELPSLRTLWITGFPSSENYHALADLKQLRELHFEMALTELADLEFLEEALPDAHIMAGTGGGWVGGFRGLDEETRIIK